MRRVEAANRSLTVAAPSLVSGFSATKMKTPLRFTCLAVLSAVFLFAHDFWIEPSSYQVPVGGKVTIRFRVGEHFRGDPLPLDPQRVVVFSHLGPKTETPVKGVPGLDPAGVATLDEPGLHLIAYRGTSTSITLDPQEFEAYLRQEGLERIIEERSRRNESNAPGRELFARCVKSLLRTPGSGEETGFDRVLGFPAELVPDTNPYHLEVGDELSLRVRSKGRPLAGALVTAYPHAEPSEPVQQRSDANGRVTLRLDRAGPWLIKSVHMERLEESEQAHWQSWWASLTFELPRD